MRACGHVFKYGDNVDTDVIIPARYLNSFDAKELASHAMADIDPEFVNKVQEGDLIVANKNFGCGSSREHAPLCLKTAKELASHAMADIDPEFVNKVQEGDLIVANKNFGCGSSREHAPLCLKTAGVSCVIAETFARIFYRNAINIGLPIIECPEAAKGIEAGDEVEVDFDSGKIYNHTKGTEFQGQAFPEFMQKIIKAGGLVNYTNMRR